MAEVTTGKGEPAIRLSAVWVAEQFAELRTTLGFVREQVERQATKEAAQDVVIDKLARDVAEIKSELRGMKEAQPAKVSVPVILTAIVATAGFLLGLLNQLYGA